jgi:hypothetical protein
MNLLAFPIYPRKPATAIQSESNGRNATRGEKIFSANSSGKVFKPRLNSLTPHISFSSLELSAKIFLYRDFLI